MIIVISLLSVFWCVRIVANILTYTQLWYVKEYRLDRMLIHLGTAQGKRLWFPAFRRPPISPKTVTLVCLTLALAGLAFFSLPLPVLVKLLLVDGATFPVMATLVLLLGLPTRLYHEILIGLATQKLRRHKKMIVIGITGSFGKTSTKEYVSALLSAQYEVLKTPASKNSPIAVAEVILRDLRPDHEVFVVEMAAYKPGEIARMADIVHPDIGIVTAINEQHQDLFGSIDNTMKAKYELVAGLVDRRIVVINADNPHTRTMGQWAARDGNTVWYYTVDPKSFDCAFVGSQVKAYAQSLTFCVTHASETVTVNAPVIGAFQAQNILAAIAGAVGAGMTLTKAAVAAGQIQPVEKMMHRFDGPHGVTFIDDTFNNNPDAAIAALDVLSTTTGKKVLVFQPMIELGAYAQRAHERVGARAASVCDGIVLTNNNYMDAFMKGVHAVFPQKKVFVYDNRKAAEYIRRVAKPGDTVLFKGKEAALVLASLLKGTHAT